MVLSPADRGPSPAIEEGMCPACNLQLQPHLTASWDFAEIRNVRVGTLLYENQTQNEGFIAIAYCLHDPTRSNLTVADPAGRQDFSSSITKTPPVL